MKRRKTRRGRRGPGGQYVAPGTEPKVCKPPAMKHPRSPGGPPPEPPPGTPLADAPAPVILHNPDGKPPYVCDHAAPGQQAVTEALVEELGFCALPFSQLASALHHGHRVLVHGWRAAYSSLAVRYPGLLVCLWHSGWTGSELMGECRALASVLAHLREGRITLLWLEGRDVLPDGALHCPPFWSPKLMKRRAEACKHIERSETDIVVGLHGAMATMPKNVVAAVAASADAAKQVGAKLHISKTTVRDGDRAHVLPALLDGVEHELHDTMTRDEVMALLSKAALLVHPSLSETWPGLLIEAAYAGCPAVMSPVVPWICEFDNAGLAVCDPTDTISMGSLVAVLVNSPDERAQLAAEQLRALEGVAETQIAAARELYASIGLGPSNIEPIRSAADGRPKVLLVSDVRGWAFDQNMHDLEATLGHVFDFDHWYVVDYQKQGYIPDLDDYQAIFMVYHRWSIKHLMPKERTVSSLRGLWFFPENQVPPGDAEKAFVNSWAGFHVVTHQNFLELRDDCPNAVYLTNPVRMARFPEPTPVYGEVIASWNGNDKHRCVIGPVKGFSEIIQPAAAVADVPLVWAEYNTPPGTLGGRLAPSEMPAFYRRSNLAVCASMYEGASNSVMEAMASGLALITTDCGNAREMQEAQLAEFGESGIIIVDRTERAIAKAMAELKKDPERVRAMGLLNRAEIEARWSWKVWAEGYERFLRLAMK